MEGSFHGGRLLKTTSELCFATVSGSVRNRVRSDPTVDKERRKGEVPASNVLRTGRDRYCRSMCPRGLDFARRRRERGEPCTATGGGNHRRRRAAARRPGCKAGKRRRTCHRRRPRAGGRSCGEGCRGRRPGPGAWCRRWRGISDHPTRAAPAARGVAPASRRR